MLVEVPDLEIFTQGYDFADAIYMARDAMGLKGISLEDRKLHVPKPSDPSKSLNPENSEFSKLGGPSCRMSILILKSTEKVSAKK